MCRKVQLVVLTMILFTGYSATAASKSAITQSRKQQIKAAFIYNFLNFIEWPKEKMSDNDTPIIIGIIGDNNFIKAFDPIKDKKIKDKAVTLKSFNKTVVLQKDKDTIESLRQCHVIIICTRKNDSPIDPELLSEELDNAFVLLIGEQEKFLEHGGHINFLIEEQKVCFEINLKAAKDDGLKIRSKLLKLAKRVI